MHRRKLQSRSAATQTTTMPPSPNTDSDGVLRVRILANGSELPQTVSLVSLTVRRAVNAIPSARLVIADGDMATGEFSVADSALLVPGTKIAVHLGYADSDALVYRGVVVRFGLKITGNNVSHLEIDCRDQAEKMALGRRDATHLDTTDSAMIEALVAAHGLAAKVDATTVTHRALVQHHCSDWDFMRSRAEANGRLVIVTDGEVSVKAPQTSAAPLLKVAYGESLMEFDADIDARTQWTAVDTVAWDPSTQAVTAARAAPQDLGLQGNLQAAALAQVAGPDRLRLQTSARQDVAALTEWAKAQQTKAALARVRGRMRFQGSALAQVGGLIELEGVGARFNGKVFVGKLTHEVSDGNWTTEVEFGLSPQWPAEQADVIAPEAAGLLPGVRGLQIGVVTKLDADPAAEHRIQVRLPLMGDDAQPVWARLAALQASNGFGTFFVPEVGDEVLLGFLNGDPGHPVVLGSVHSSSHPPPYTLTDENNTTAIVTRGRSKIEINDRDKVITINTPGANRLVFDDMNQSIQVSDQNGNTIRLGTDGIRLDSPKDIVIQAKGSLTIDAVGPLSMTSKADASTQALNVRCEAQVGFTAKGSASAELSAAGQTTIQGAMVMIN